MSREIYLDLRKIKAVNNLDLSFARLHGEEFCDLGLYRSSFIVRVAKSKTGTA